MITNNNQITKKQHIIPKCYLKQFCTKKLKGSEQIVGLHIYDKETKKTYFKSIGSEFFYKNFYYEHDNMPNKNFIEKQILGNIEDEWSKKNVPKLGAYYFITNDDKKIMSKFIRILLYRTVLCRKELERFRKSLSDIDFKIINLNENEKYVLNEIKNDPKMVQLDLIQDTSFDLKLINDYHWYILYTSNPMHKFILSDSPLIPLKIFNDKHAIDFRIINDFEQLFLPITPERAIMLVKKKKNGINKKENKIKEINRFHLRTLNQFQIINANKYVYYSKDIQLKVIIDTLNSIELINDDSGCIGKLWPNPVSTDYTY